MTIDIDKLFEEYFKKFIAENMGKYTEDELESKVAEIYGEFGSTKLDELGGKTPEEYFKEMSSEELVNCLADCVKNGTPVSDYLCDELEKREDSHALLVEFVSSTELDELATYAVNILNASGSKIALKKYVDVICEGKAKESLIEAVTEALADNANEIKEEILAVYDKNQKSAKYFVEILSCVSFDDRVFEILCDEFLTHTDNLALYATYLSKYGDDRALPLLYEQIKKDGISYIDYKEMKLAIEALGGEYEDGRNFQKDKIFKKLRSN